MKLFWNGKQMKTKNKKTAFAYEEYHPEDGSSCWNGIIHEHHGWQTKRPKYIPVVSRQNGKSIVDLYVAAKQAGLPLEQIKELIKDIYGYDC